MYEAGESPIDPAKTPDEYLGQWNAGIANGIGSDVAAFAYYAVFDAGARMSDWWPTGVGYYCVIDLLPSAYGGNHPTATKNYTAYSSIAQWNTLVDYFWIHMTPFDTLLLTPVGADVVLTWTQLPQVNNTLAGYTIYKSVGGAAWTNVQETGLVGTWTDVGGYAAATRYCMAPRFAENFHIYGRSNIVATVFTPVVLPIADAGPDQTVNEGTLVTFDGSGSVDSDGSITNYWWNFTYNASAQSLTGIGPTFTFWTPGVYTVTLTVMDNDGWTDTDTVIITVEEVLTYDAFEFQWTKGWNLWSMPLIRSENASLGLNDLTFSWFARAHHNDTALDPTFIDDATFVAWNGASYQTYVHPVDEGTANDLTVVPDRGYWVDISESWFADEVLLLLPPAGILVTGQIPSDYVATRTVAISAGWNLLGWTSSISNRNVGSAMVDLFTPAFSPQGIRQPELACNWTAEGWSTGVRPIMTLYEGNKTYTSFLRIGASVSSSNYDFILSPGYGFWIYSETGAQSFQYPTS